MINPNWEVVDIDPHTWRALGQYLKLQQYFRASQPGDHDLFVLHDNGKLLRIVDTQQGLRTDLGIAAVDDPGRIAHQLFLTEEWHRVHVINKRHLASVAAYTAATPRNELHLDEYYHLVYRQLWGIPEGYVCAPPKPGNWNHWRIGDIKAFISNLPKDSTLAIGVIDRERIDVGLLAQFHAGVIERVTTFEALDLAGETIQVCSKSVDIIWQQIRQKFAPPGAVLLCTPAVFEAWMHGENKRQVLQLAIAAKTAALAIQKDIDPTGLSGYAAVKET